MSFLNGEENNLVLRNIHMIPPVQPSNDGGQKPKLWANLSTASVLWKSEKPGEETIFQVSPT
jgi:hypothetical protein